MLEFYIISDCPAKGLYRNYKKAKRQYQRYPEAKLQKFCSPGGILTAKAYCADNNINVKKEEWEDLLTAGRLSQFALERTPDCPFLIPGRQEEGKRSNPAKSPGLPPDAEVVVYTDGSYIETEVQEGKTIKSGGYAALIIMRKVNEAEIAISGCTKKAADSCYMELLAISKALSRLKRYKINGKVALFSDAQSVVLDYNKKLAGWQECGWKTANGNYIKHWKLWRKIWKKSQGLTLQVHWIKGHANKYNKRCDSTAYAEALLQAREQETETAV
jgi:ribonuclease HI